LTPSEHLEACLKIIDDAVRNNPKYDYLSVPQWLRLVFKDDRRVDSRWHWDDKPRTIVYMMVDGNDVKFQMPRYPGRYDNMRLMRDAVLRADR